MKLVILAPRDRVRLRSYLADMQGVSRQEVSDDTFYQVARMMEEQFTAWNHKCFSYEGIARGWVPYQIA